MNSMTNLVVLTPTVVGIFLQIFSKSWRPAETSDNVRNSSAVPQSFYYPQGAAGIMFGAAIVIPLVTFFLPDSIVLDVRPMFNFLAICASLLCFFCWFYFRRYKVVVDKDFIEYGAFKTKRVDLRGVTEIRYHWVNNGINLKLFSGEHRIALFEGGIVGFDDFAKCVRARLPSTVIVKTEGRATL